MLKALFSALLVSVFVGQAHAGDQAQFKIIGLSQDGRYTATEEYGIQSGAGFPFATIGFYDNEKNSQVGNTIVIVDPGNSNGEMKPLAEVRDQAAKKAKAQLNSFKIKVGNTGIVPQTYETGSNLGINTYSLAKGIPQKNIALELKQFQLAPPLSQNCSGLETKTRGLEMNLIFKANDGTVVETRNLVKDVELPVSRSCPLGYKIKDVIFSEKGHLIFVIEFETAGFEGSDVRSQIFATKI